MNDQTAETAEELIDSIRSILLDTPKGIKSSGSNRENWHIKNSSQHRISCLENASPPKVKIDGFSEALSQTIDRFERLAYRNGFEIPKKLRQSIVDQISAELEENIIAFAPDMPLKMASLTVYQGTEITKLRGNGISDRKLASMAKTTPRSVHKSVADMLGLNTEHAFDAKKYLARVRAKSQQDGITLQAKPSKEEEIHLTSTLEARRNDAEKISGKTICDHEIKINFVTNPVYNLITDFERLGFRTGMHFPDEHRDAITKELIREFRENLAQFDEQMPGRLVMMTIYRGTDLIPALERAREVGIPSSLIKATAIGSPHRCVERAETSIDNFIKLSEQPKYQKLPKANLLRESFAATQKTSAQEKEQQHTRGKSTMMPYTTNGDFDAAAFVQNIRNAARTKNIQTLMPSQATREKEPLRQQAISEVKNITKPFNDQSPDYALNHLMHRFEIMAKKVNIDIPDEHRIAITSSLLDELNENRRHIETKNASALATLTLHHGTLYLAQEERAAAHGFTKGLFTKIPVSNPTDPFKALNQAIANLTDLRSNPKYQGMADSHLKTAVIQKPNDTEKFLDEGIESGKIYTEPDPETHLDDVLETIESMEQDTRAIPKPLWFAENNVGISSAFGNRQYDHAKTTKDAVHIKQFELYEDLPDWAFDYHAQNTGATLPQKMRAIANAIEIITQDQDGQDYENTPKWAVTLAALNTARTTPEDIEYKTRKNLEQALDISADMLQKPEFEELQDTPDVFLYAALQQTKRTDLYLEHLLEEKSTFKTTSFEF